MAVEMFGSLAYFGLILGVAVIVTAVDEHRQRKRDRESEKRAIQKIKERRKAA